MKVFLRFALPVLLLAFSAPSYLLAAESRRADCGEYNFELPQGFELRHIEINTPDFSKNLDLNQPFEQKDLSSATVTCVREKKTAQQEFSLPHKEKINFLTAARRSSVQMLISATENARHDDMRLKFSLLEERTANSRVINGRERFIVSIEMDATGDDWHTMLFVSDFRKLDGFFEADEYRSHVTGIAVKVMDSIRKRLP